MSVAEAHVSGTPDGSLERERAAPACREALDGDLPLVGSTDVDALEALDSLLGWQRRLLAFPRAVNLQRGELELGGEVWRFQVHGAGILFENAKTGLCADAHVRPSEPDFLDAWRLLLFAESVGARSLLWQGRSWSAESEESIELLLESLAKAGELEPVLAYPSGYRRLRRPETGR